MSDKIPYVTTKKWRDYRMQDTIYFREDFNAHSMKGRKVAWEAGDKGSSWPVTTHPDDVYGVDMGQLPMVERAMFRTHKPTYVVWSYSTPIGWWSEAHGWYVPDTRYSTTSSHHQGIVRSSALAEPPRWWARTEDTLRAATSDPGPQSGDADPFVAVAQLTYDPATDTLHRVR